MEQGGSRTMRAARLLLLLTGVWMSLLDQPLQAAPSDPLGTITPPCQGIGVAFDGTNILYTCADEAAVRKTDLAGADRGLVATVDGGGNPVSVDAIAWDDNETRLWGGDLDGKGHCRIWSIDLATGLATLRFSFGGDGCALPFSFFDGLTVDTVTNTLYLSPDVQRFIRHLNKDGTPAANDPIDFETLTSAPDRCPSSEPVPNPNPVDGCPNSGLAIGLDGILFAGTNGAGRIIQLDPNPPAFLGDFATVSGRDEDLECGPRFSKADGSVVETILSRDFFSGRIDILEAPQGTCITQNRPPICTGATASPSTIWPPNHMLVGVGIIGVTDPDGDPVTITPTGVFQDEPLKATGIGSGNTSPDATLSPLQVRAERNGTGDGRMYHINFEAHDGKGGGCTGTVRVCVPHDQRPGSSCIDGGPLFNSIMP